MKNLGGSVRLGAWCGCLFGLLACGPTHRVVKGQSDCDSGSAQACNELASWYGLGVEGLSKDDAAQARLRQRSVELNRKACEEKGDREACESAAGFEKVPAAHARLVDKGCALGSESLCTERAKTGAPSQGADGAKAFAHLNSRCPGDDVACRQLVEILTSGTSSTPANPARVNEIRLMYCEAKGRRDQVCNPGFVSESEFPKYLETLRPTPVVAASASPMQRLKLELLGIEIELPSSETQRWVVNNEQANNTSSYQDTGISRELPSGSHASNFHLEVGSTCAHTLESVATMLKAKRVPRPAYLPSGWASVALEVPKKNGGLMMVTCLDTRRGALRVMNSVTSVGPLQTHIRTLLEAVAVGMGADVLPSSVL